MQLCASLVEFLLKKLQQVLPRAQSTECLRADGNATAVMLAVAVRLSISLEQVEARLGNVTVVLTTSSAQLADFSSLAVSRASVVLPTAAFARNVVVE